MAAMSIPVVFVPDHLAVNEEKLIEMMNWTGSRQAKKKNAYRFLTKHNIKALPGRVFPLRKIEAACAGE